MNSRSLLLCILLLCVPVSASAGSAIFFNDVSVEKFKTLLETSPVISNLDNDSSKQCEIDAVEMHFKKFNMFNAPNLVDDWEYHYVVGEPSKPEWKTEFVADIVAYQEKIDDSAALMVFRNKASEFGGCAVQEVFREPILMNRFADGSKAFGLGGAKAVRKILGYAYYGKIVRRSSR